MGSQMTLLHIYETSPSGSVHFVFTMENAISISEHIEEKLGKTEVNQHSFQKHYPLL